MSTLADLYVKDLLYTHDDHGPLSASFKVAVEDAYAPYPPAIALGQWVELGDAHRGWDGEVASIVPSIDDAGKHWLSVSCDGLQKVAARRNDLRVVFTHRGGDGWMRRPDATEIGSFVTNTANGILDLQVPKGSTEDFSVFPNKLQVIYVLHDLVSDQEISYIDYAAALSIANEAATGYTWTLAVYVSPDIQAASYSLQYSYTGATTSAVRAFAPPAGTKVVMLSLYCGTAAHTVDATKSAFFSKFDIYSSGLTSKVRLDEAMVTLATKPGRAVSATSKRVGPPQDHMELGSAESPLNAWSGLETLEAMHSQPITNRFNMGRTYEVGPRLWYPKDKSKIIVVGGDHPGLKPGGWQVDETEQPAQYVEVIFKNAATGGDSTKPEGWLRRIVRPCEPPDDNVRLDSLNLPYILTDVNAAACGDFVVGRAPAEIPKGYSFYFHAARCVGEAPYFPGDNDDTTERGTVHELSDYHAAGTLMNFNTWDGVVDGYSGSNSPADPSCLVFNGVDDCVSFGDLAALDFGAGPRTVMAWWIPAAVGASYEIFTKRPESASRTGWSLLQSSSSNFYRYEVNENYGSGAYRRVYSNVAAQADVLVCILGIYDGNEVSIDINGVDVSGSRDGTAGVYNTDNAAAAAFAVHDPTGTPTAYGKGRLVAAAGWPRVLTTAERMQVYLAGPYLYHRNLSKGTVQLEGICENMLGGKVPCDHITPIDYWIRHDRIGRGEPLMVRATAQKPSEDPSKATNALTIGEDDMLEQIAVRRATALALAETITADVTESDTATEETSSGTTGDYVVDSRRGSADRGRRKGYRKPVGRPPKKAPGGHGKSHGGAEDYDPRRRPPKKTPKPPRRRRT